MWEEYTDRAQRALFFAHAEAARLGAGYVGPEHLLVGLTRDAGSVAGRVLERVGFPPRRVRRALKSILVAGERRPVEDLVPHASFQRALSLAREESRALGYRRVGPEHLLLGVLRQGDGPAAEVFAAAGVDAEAVRQALIRFVSGGPASLLEVPGGERLRSRARRVVWLAQEEAARQGQERVMPEHLLSAIAQEEQSLAARVLVRQGVDLDRLRQELAASPAAARLAAGEVSLDPRARAVFEWALEEARQQPEADLGTEHLLLGILRQGDGPAAAVLAAMGVDLEGTRQAVQAALSGSPSLRSAIRKKLEASLNRRSEADRGSAAAES